MNGSEDLRGTVFEINNKYDIRRNHRGALYDFAPALSCTAVSGESLRSCLRTERGCPKPWVSMNEYLSVAVYFEYLHNGFVNWTIYLGEINLYYWETLITMASHFHHWAR